MNIRLYGESDTRPVGDYDWVVSAYVTPMSITFVTQTGKQILSNLRYKITFDLGDNISYKELNFTHEIVGAKKPSAKPDPNFDPPTSTPTDKSVKTKKVAKDEPNKKPLSGLVPRGSENPGADSDESYRARAKRKASSTGDKRSQGDLFQD